MNTSQPLRLTSQTREIGARPVNDDGKIPLFRQYLRIATRWRMVFAGFVLGGLVLALIATLLMTPKYTATTTIEITRDSNKIVNIQDVQQETSVADQEFYQTQYGLLRARSLADRVAQQLGFADDPAFFKMFRVKLPTQLAQLGRDGRYAPAGHGERQRRAAETLLKHLDVTPTRLSRLADVSFTGPDAALAARIVNTWASSFIQMTLERRYQATAYARTFLESRLDQLRRRLEESERQLVSYASAQQIINLPAASGQGENRTVERSIVADDLAALNAQLSQATADRVQAEARFDQSRATGGEQTEALTNVAINQLREKRAELAAEYQRLMVQFEPGYPTAKAIASQIAQLDRSIAREEGRVSSSLASDYRAALQRQQGLASRVDRLKSGLLDLRRRSIQYAIFQREVDTNRELYDGLLQRYKEIGVAGGVGVNNVSVVDTADVPERPSSPRLGLNLALGILAGIVFGVLVVIILEQSDESIADPGEVERLLSVPLIGSVPMTVGQTPIDALHDRKSELIDAYLAVQTNLEFSTEHGVPRSISITSTRPGEGKSTTAFALALMLARSRKKVVLIDGDMRSPSVHTMIGTTHTKGLSNYLAGNDDLESLLEKTDDGLTVMTAGPIPPNAAELLTGERLPKLIERLLQSYDHVVIDTPPVMGLADAPLIGSRVEAVVFAVEAHGIRASLARTALGRLASASARVIGGVLVKFESQRAHFGYGYDYGYGYGHEPKSRGR
ncbi:GumC family protein [Sphingomonas crusticola]|uniref:GumC family protein n=1 Tax=Sphingomonas crusticola TaxID=1697973 RepID=UPI001967428F|nr:polysaccharide biosynthesis tyrosine autokinase [Sphingomonas crusticola]